MSTPTDQVKGAAAQASDQAKEAAGTAKGKVRDQVDQRSTVAGEQVTTAAQDARSVAEELRKQGKDQPAKLAEQAADRAERLGGYLKSSDTDTFLSDIEDFGRRQPMALALGGMALGFAASRFLKASAEQRYAGGSVPRPGVQRGPTPNGLAAPTLTPSPATPATPATTGLTPATPPVPVVGSPLPIT